MSENGCLPSLYNFLMCRAGEYREISPLIIIPVSVLEINNGNKEGR